MPNEVEWRRLANGNRDIFERAPVVNYTLGGRPTDRAQRSARGVRPTRSVVAVVIVVVSAIYKHNRAPARRLRGPLPKLSELSFGLRSTLNCNNCTGRRGYVGGGEDGDDGGRRSASDALGDGESGRTCADLTC